MKNNQKFTLMALALMAFVMPAKAQEQVVEAPKLDKNTVVLGVGALNATYLLVNALDQVQLSDTSFFASITQNSTKPLYFIKYEYKLGRRHTLGANFANSGFTVGGLVRDSFFLNDLGVLTQTSLDFTYTSRSLNFRYNYIFNPNAGVKVYWGLGVGVRGNSIKVKTNNKELGQFLDLPGFNLASAPSLGFESTLGIRSDIVENIGWYSELGIAKGFFQCGLTYRF